MKKKVIVTGGAGFIGSHLVDALVKKGYEVHVIDDLSAGKKEQVNPQALLHVVDITDLEALRPFFKDTQYVFHLAAQPRVQDSIDTPLPIHHVNVTGTLNVLVASAGARVKKFVFTSSAAVYGDQPIMPLHEDMQPTPKSPYGLHKLIGEQYTKLWSELYQMPTVSLRYFNAYGPRQSAQGSYPLVIAKFFDLRVQGKPLTIVGSGNQTRDFIHVTDIAAANILAAERDHDATKNGSVFNIGTGQQLSVKKIAELIGGEIQYLPARIEPQNSVAATTRAQEILGWKPQISIEQGIAELKRLHNIV